MGDIFKQAPIFASFAFGLIAAVLFCSVGLGGRYLLGMTLTCVALAGWAVSVYFGFRQSIFAGWMCILTIIPLLVPVGWLCLVWYACESGRGCI